MTKLITVGGLILALSLINYSIWQKEQHLREGRAVYLQLAPVDPRSLIQGDYMALNFAIADEIQHALNNGEDAPRKAYVIVSLDERNIAHFKSLDSQRELADNEVRLRYRIGNQRVRFATDAFFFQEGTAQDYEAARFGHFRVDEDGELLLTAMHDENLKRLGLKHTERP